MEQSRGIGFKRTAGQGLYGQNAFFTAIGYDLGGLIKADVSCCSLERQHDGAPGACFGKRTAISGFAGREGYRCVEVGTVGQNQVGAGIGIVAVLHHDVRTRRRRHSVLYHKDGVPFGEANARRIGIEFRYLVGRTVIQLGGIDAHGLVGGQHGIVVCAYGLAPCQFRLVALQQHGHLAALELIGGLYAAVFFRAALCAYHPILIRITIGNGTRQTAVIVAVVSYKMPYAVVTLNGVSTFVAVGNSTAIVSADYGSGDFIFRFNT